MKKEDKSTLVEKIQSTIGEYDHFYLADIAGMNAEETSELRKDCFKKDIRLMVVKNTLLKKALENDKNDFQPMEEIIKGSTSVFLSNTGNAPAKLIKEFSKKNRLKKPLLKGAYVEEGFYLGENQLEFLTTIKSKNELIADIVALLQSPAKNVVSALQSGGTTIHGVLTTLAERK